MTERDAEAAGFDQCVFDQADRLAKLLYGRSAKARDLMHGSNAQIFSDASNRIEMMRAEVIEECAKWHDDQFAKYAKLAKEAADRQDMTSNGFHADTAQHHMISAAALRSLKAHRN
jgi:hypothetical protein